jgi:hypothetical protein
LMPLIAGTASGDPEVHRAKQVPVGEIEGLHGPDRRGTVGCLRLAVDDELLAIRVSNPATSPSQ